MKHGQLKTTPTSRVAHIVMSVMLLELALGCHDPAVIPTVPVTNLYGKLHNVAVQMEHADIEQDVNAALHAGDRREIGVMGIGLVVPGIDRATLDSMHLDVNVIPHTTDSISSAEEMEFQDIAYRYAERYNRVLMTKLPHPQSQPAR